MTKNEIVESHEEVKNDGKDDYSSIENEVMGVENQPCGNTDSEKTIPKNRYFGISDVVEYWSQFGTGTFESEVCWSGKSLYLWNSKNQWIMWKFPTSLNSDLIWAAVVVVSERWS